MAKKAAKKVASSKTKSAQPVKASGKTVGKASAAKPASKAAPKAVAAKSVVKSAAKSVVKAVSKLNEKMAEKLKEKPAAKSVVVEKPLKQAKSIAKNTETAMEEPIPEMDADVTAPAVKAAKTEKPPKAPKPPKPEKVDKKAEKKAKADRLILTEGIAKWNDLHDRFKNEKAQIYNMSAQFEANRPIQHKVLGWGFVLNNDNDRLEVLFEQGVKMLISNYKTGS